jgi:Fe-S-cluster containining protein
VGYDCRKCPGYCCSYPLIEVDQADIDRLAKFHGITPDEARDRFTRYDAEDKSQGLKMQKDAYFKQVCMFFDVEKRCCTIYEGRPGVCRDYPFSKTCGYWEFLRFERKHSGDKKAIALTWV